MKKLEELVAEIKPIDRELCREAVKKWDSIAKPLRSLGMLEDMVTQLVGITGELEPRTDKKAVLIYCADNGVVEENVTQTGSEVTAAVARSFIKGVATVNSFCRVAGVDVFPVDVGISAEMLDAEGLIDRKISFGTKNIAKGPAMTRQECESAIITGINMVGELKNKGYNLIATGEMGIGNTTTSSAVLSVLESLSVESVTGKGAGLSNEGLQHKIEIIKRAVELNNPDKNDVIDVMSKLGGFDICALAGTFLGGAIYRIPIIIDGFISAVSADCAIKIAPLCADYMFASHVSAEPAGQTALDAIGKKAYINCGMCLGEGTGAVICAKLFDFALAGYNEAASFEAAKVEQYRLF